MNSLHSVSAGVLGLCALAVVSGSLLAARAGTPGAPPTPMHPDGAAVVKGNTAFALELYARLRERDGNLFLSPYSVSTALAMTYAGARGDTAAQMADVLHFDLKGEALHRAFGQLVERLNEQGEKGGYQLSVANALWGQKGYGFLKEFLDLTEAHYGAGLHEVDFEKGLEAARQTINAWVEEETQDKIKELIPKGALDVLTRLVLTNAIYFKGDWASPFEEEETKDEPFTLLDGQKLDVPMMHQTEKFGYAEDEGLQVLELPYVGKELSMVVLLPKSADGLADLEKSLTAENLEKWLAGLRRRNVVVALPRFKVTCGFALGKALKSMGMTDAFSPAAADFSGMNGGKEPLWIGAVIHKAFVEVNEEGTEAAAATAVMMVGGMARPEPTPVFRADHPFLFLIRDTRTGSILFLGRVANPVE